MTDEELFAVIRGAHDQLKRRHEEGHGPKIDKKLFRFNDIAAVARRYEAEAPNPDWGLQQGLFEAIDCCLIGSPSHIPGRGPLTLLEGFDWMQPASERLPERPGPAE